MSEKLPEACELEVSPAAEPEKRGRGRPRKDAPARPKPQSREEASRAKMRRCLKCQKMFMSDGPGNRICGECPTYKGIDFGTWHR